MRQEQYEAHGNKRTENGELSKETQKKYPVRLEKPEENIISRNEGQPTRQHL